MLTITGHSIYQQGEGFEKNWTIPELFETCDPLPGEPLADRNLAMQLNQDPMEYLFKIGIIGLLVLVFTNCYRMKTNEPTLSDWLEEHYPGRFQVLSTNTTNPIRNLSFKVKKSVVAERSDTLVQALVGWDQRDAELGLTTTQIDHLFANAALEIQDARTLFQKLEAGGFKNMATGIHDKIASVLIFDEPTAERRQENLDRLEKAFADWSAADKYDKELLFLEPVEYGKHFQEIAPLSFWAQSTGQYMKYVIFQLFCPYTRPFIAEDLKQDWTFNTLSSRFSDYFDQAQKAATTWAQEHLERPVTLQDISENSQDGKDPALMIFQFSFVNTLSEGENSTEEVDGKIMVRFNLDTQSIETVERL